MSEAGITSEHDFHNLLQSAERARNAEIMAPVLRDIQVDTAREAGVSLKTLTVQEAICLGQRLDFLDRHPKLPVFLGGSALGFVNRPHNRNALTLTVPLFTTDAERCVEDDIRRDFEVQSSFQFGIERSNPGRYKPGYVTTLKVFQHNTELVTGESKRKSLYQISAYQDDDPRFYRVNGATFTKYASQKRRAIRQEFEEKHPWAQDFYILHDMGWEIFEPGAKDYDEMQERRKQNQIIRDELVPQLDPGPDSWEFPDELYYFPLGLLRAANQIFGTKQR